VNEAVETAGAGPIRAPSPRPVRSRGPWRRAFDRFRRRKLAVTALAVLLLLFLVGALASVVAPYSYTQLDLNPAHLNVSPTFAGHHFFGTDQLGRDNFSRVLWGIRNSVVISLSVAAAATLIGLVVGAACGYYGGWLDSVLMRGVDLIAAVPVLAAMFTAIVFFGRATPFKVGFILVVYLWASVARVIRGTFLQLRETEFVEAARAAGASNFRIITRHLVPNAQGPLIAAATLLVGQAVLLEATIDFFDYGADSNARPSLGNLLASAVEYGFQGYTFWWLYAFPAIFIVVMLVCVNFVGDSLDDALNPTARVR
jgi:peptide/nickel transport system permease protein